MAAEVVNVNVWTTSGLSGGWQVLSGSDASFMPASAAFDVTGPIPFVTLGVPISVQVQAPPQPRVIVEAPADRDELRVALLNVLQFHLEPDEPTDADVGSGPSLQFFR